MVDLDESYDIPDKDDNMSEDVSDMTDISVWLMYQYGVM